ncbi:hypothetical protein ACFLXD_01630 [Chloroflexota bacterium]
MLTIFATPKPFSGHIGVIQTNAIRSWFSLHPECEVILFGDEEGTAEVADELGTRYIPDVDCNEYGTPLVSSLFSTAQTHASHEVVCYVNADIILTSDFIKVVRQIHERPSLVIGRRWDLDVEKPLDFSNPDWEIQLRSDLQMKGKLHGIYGIDYFAFSRGAYRDILPFAIGRNAWDNWLIYKARASGLPVIDATKAVTIIHQNHDYSHLSKGQENDRKAEEFDIECTRNRELLRGDYHAFGILEATHLLTPDGLKPTITMSLRYLAHRVYRLPELHPRLIPLVQLIKVLRFLYDRQRR